MNNKLTDDQLDEVHGGLLLVDENENVYLVDEANYGILYQCTLARLSSAAIPALYKRFGLVNISELSDIDKAFNEPVALNLKRKGVVKLSYTGYLPRGRYLRIVKGSNGLPQVLNEVINVP